jgi:hypothetical protein
MRMRFCAYCVENLPDHEIFLPEFAIENIFSTEPDEQFDIADFEHLISELSHAVVLFPEAAGSYAETGYFSAVKTISKRCILVLNLKYQKKDSFISLGPAKKIASNSIFHPLIQIDYDKPNFDSITERIKRFSQNKYKKRLYVDKFSNLNTYDLSCLIYQIVNLLTITTVDDILYTFKVLFKNSYSMPKVRKLLSILVGSKYLRHIGEYGHLCINPRKPQLLEIVEGYSEEEREIRLLLAEIYQGSDADFLSLVMESRDVD